MQTWASPTGQPNYYEMPRPPGARIESPGTLGMKCWAFAYLAQTWASLRESLLARLQAAGLSIERLADGYAAAAPLTHSLCLRVMENCFVNATFDPARKGTCPMSVDEFRGGFARQNAEHGDIIKYPF